MADVKVNSKRFPVLWKHPYRLDVTGAVHAGRNSIEVAAMIPRPNRLIGPVKLIPAPEVEIRR